MDYFSGCSDDQARKKRFKDLAKKHHPDKGGDAETFKEINRQYKAGSPKAKAYDDPCYEDFWGAYSSKRDWGHWDFAFYFEEDRKMREESIRREEERRAKQAEEVRERMDKFYRDKSQPKSEHEENIVSVNSRDTLKMFSIYGNHEYKYDVFSDTWVRK